MRKQKTLQEMNLTDNFLFSAAMENEKAGRLIAKTILETVLDRKIRIKAVHSEKIIWGDKPEKHAIRLDAYVDEEGESEVLPGNVYDMEPDNRKSRRKELPKRSRYYHARIDGRLLKAGKDYNDLPSVWVIFITTFDPFDKGRMVYTIRNQCLEVPSMPYDDGATTLFLYTKGTEGDPPKKLRELLKYLEETVKENIRTQDMQDIQDCIDSIKKDPEVEEHYMDWKYYIDCEREEAAEEAAREAELRVRAEKERADAAEKRADTEKNRADTEKNRADTEKNRADTEKNRADTAEERIKALEEMLRLHGLQE